MMNEKMNYADLPDSAFERVPMEGRLHDQALESKPIGSFRDALNRFCRNKSSVVAAGIIVILLLYALLVPWLCETNYSRALRDTTYLQYIKLPPKVKGLEWLGMGGTKASKINETDYIKMKATAQETGHTPIAEIINDAHVDPKSNSKVNYYDVKVDVYQNMGMMYLTLTPAQYEDIQAWQDEHQVQVISLRSPTQSRRMPTSGMRCRRRAFRSSKTAR